METCDTLLILGSTMPWIDFYPRPNPQQWPPGRSRFRAARGWLWGIRLRIVSDRLRRLRQGLRCRRVRLRETGGNSTGDHVGFLFAQTCDRRSRRAASQTWGGENLI